MRRDFEATLSAVRGFPQNVGRSGIAGALRPGFGDVRKEYHDKISSVDEGTLESFVSLRCHQLSVVFTLYIIREFGPTVRPSWISLHVRLHDRRADEL